MSIPINTPHLKKIYDDYIEKNQISIENLKSSTEVEGFINEILLNLIKEQCLEEEELKTSLLLSKEVVAEEISSSKNELKDGFFEIFLDCIRNINEIIGFNKKIQEIQIEISDEDLII